MSRDADDILLPSYRPRSYSPNSPRPLKEREVTPAVVRAANPQMASPEKIFVNGEVVGGIRMSDIARNVGMSHYGVRKIFNGETKTRSASKIVIAAYLQISLEELNTIIARRKKSWEEVRAARERARQAWEAKLAGAD